MSAKIEIQNPKIPTPDKLWFKLPQSFREYITDHNDAFVATMLLTAMALGEDFKVKGTMSLRLGKQILFDIDA